MLIKQFENIIAWQKAKLLNTKLYNLLRSNRDFSYKNQIIRASISIMNNIAEGFERKGNKKLFENYNNSFIKACNKN